MLATTRRKKWPQPIARIREFYSRRKRKSVLKNELQVLKEVGNLISFSPLFAILYRNTKSVSARYQPKPRELSVMNDVFWRPQKHPPAPSVSDCYFQKMSRKEGKYSWPLNSVIVRGTDLLQSWKSENFWLPQNLTTKSLLLTRSLSDNTNCQWTHILHMYYMLYSHNKINERQENVFTNCCKSPKYFPMIYWKKFTCKWTGAVQIQLFKVQLSWEFQLQKSRYRDKMIYGSLPSGGWSSYVTHIHGVTENKVLEIAALYETFLVS